ncbi:MAG: O-antigen ligase family protein [Hyphomicrobiaceae bacterium]
MRLISVPFPSVKASNRSLSDWYCVMLTCVLLGYVFIGKGFAYQGLPPLFIGEITLLCGGLIFLLSRAAIASISTAPAAILATMMLWVVIRTVPYIEIYGMDAPRDSITVLYGAYTFIVIALIVQNASRIDGFLSVYAFAASLFVVAGPFIFVFTRFFSDLIPTFSAPSGEPISWWSFRPGQFGVHLSGAGLFALLGLMRVNYVWGVGFILTVAMASATSRGAMLAIIVPITIVGVISGRTRLLVRVAVAGLVIMSVALIAETLLTDFREVDTLDSKDRPISVRQIISGVFSIFDQSGAQLVQTKEWRLRWWEIIQEHTLNNGPYFWTGKGFGINLADADGFQQPNEDGAPPLRDPHSVHLTILARAGVPGLVMWLSILGTWTWLLLSTAARSRREGLARWGDVLMFLWGYAMAVVIESSFDIGMAGPMMGIPFWCIIGAGIGIAMVYRATAPRLAPP